MLMTAYIGNNNTAHRVKKMYVGDSTGKARCMYNPVFFDSLLKKRSSNPSPLSSKGEGIATTTVGNYVLFAAPYSGSYNNTVDAYNSNLIKTVCTSLSSARVVGGCATAGNYAIFAGGNNEYFLSVVDTYTSSLVKGTASAACASGGTSIGSYALFHEGPTSKSKKYSTKTNVFSSNLTLSQISVYSSFSDRYAAHNSSYAIFAGGYDSTGSLNGSATAINSSLTGQNISALSEAKNSCGCLSSNIYACFVGGCLSTYSNTASSYIDKYNSSLIKSSITHSYACEYPGCTEINEKYIIGGGYKPNNDQLYRGTNIVTKYDSSWVANTIESLSYYPGYIYANTINNYALFAGGSGLASDSNSTWYNFDTVTAYMDVDTYY